MTGTGIGGARAEWKANWKVVVAAMAGVSLGAIPAYGLGLFIHPLEQEFGWSRAGISLALTITAAIGMLFSPVAGMLVDRLGSRRIAMFGVALYSLLVALLSQITSDIRTWWAAWVLIGLAGLCIKPTVWSKAVTSFFHKGRGLALALMASGAGLSTMILPSLAHALIADHGWRLAFVGIGMAYAAVILPMLWLWFCDASDKPAAAGDDRTKEQRLRDLPGWTAREGVRRRQVYQIALAALLATGIVTGYSVHIIGMLTEQGIPRGQSVAMLSLVGILAVVSRLAIGHIFDRVGSPLVGTISIALPILPALILLFAEPSLTMAACAVITLGVAIGGEYDAVLYLSSRFFGLKAFGLLFGIVASLMMAGVGLGPLAAGHIFDQTRSYDLFYVLTIPAALLSMALIATLGRYPEHAIPAEVPRR